ncbi:MAG: SpoIIE family protein phosphatase, partial [Nitrospinaceae bacterium]|nr:serine/threonine-protein phosphatase [Nitrospinaceae bacterium]NIR56541.1 serine/threonine-protein phosphatase [Nitrospinaceae bacterium]NIS86998.1 serine/threonine-protein phosphatase [Nitrospinaceae bacterium]NIT83842.1 serine/threonine-protein phosphatase [Nitrospinaceae bacterium]NIU46048.1 serine/threonine-protein phosphatase [Nitrospinaceae bacterium]
VLYEINNILYERSHRGMFSTAVFLLLDLKTKTLHAANAGHPPLLVRSRRQKVELKVPAGGMPLGILPNVRFEQETLTLKNGDSVLIYSDGVVEPR